MNPSEDPVQPSGRNAIVAVERGSVVPLVVLASEQKPRLLEKRYKARGPIQVCPEVDLIRKEERETRHADRRGGKETPCGFERHQQGGAQDGNRHQRAVAVRFHEVVAGDIRGIDVMFSKRPDEALPEEGPVGSPPGVGEPMGETGKEVCREHSQEEGGKQNPLLSAQGQNETRRQRGGGHPRDPEDRDLNAAPSGAISALPGA